MTERHVHSGTPASSERPCDRQGDVVDFAGQRVANGPCVDRDGRPVAHTNYVRPVSTNRVLAASLAGSAVVASSLVVLFFVGTPVGPDRPGMALRAALAPGPTSSPHAMASTDCAQCHEAGRNVQDVRCERCHDPGVTARLTNAAHVFEGTRDLSAAMAAPSVACVTCHVEHRGAAVNLADVDDRECGTCHRDGSLPWRRITSLARHPEFAVVRADVESGNGLSWFNHKLHLAEVQKKSGKGCDGCHERVAKAPAFAPISFDRHCASCHNEDLSRGAGSMTPLMLAALAPLTAGLKVEDDFDLPGRRVLIGFTHADPRLLRSVQALRGIIDPQGAAVERVSLDRQVAQLELLSRFAPRAPGAGAWLDPAIAAGGTPAESDAVAPDRALLALAEAIETVASQFASDGKAVIAEPTGPSPPGGAPAVPPTSSPPTPPALDGSVESLVRILEAVQTRARRAGDSSLEARAQALLERVKELPAGDRTMGVSDAAARGIEVMLLDLANLGGAGAREDARELSELARAIRQRSAAAIDPTAFDQHRLQMLQLLDTVRRSLETQLRTGRDPRMLGLLAREESLRRLLLAATYSAPPDAAGALVRFLRDRQVARSRVDSELESRGMLTAAPREREATPAGYSAPLARLSARLSDFAGPPLASTLTPEDARVALTALLGTQAETPLANAAGKNRCTMCHELTSDRLQLAPVRAAGATLMPAARFDHEPHVSAAEGNCESCHTSVRTSESARDINLPGVQRCITCHAPGRQAARASGCESCHRYHVATSGAFRWTP